MKFYLDDTIKELKDRIRILQQQRQLEVNKEIYMKFMNCLFLSCYIIIAFLSIGFSEKLKIKSSIGSEM